MILEVESTWPADIVPFIEQHRPLFDDWYGPRSEERERQRRPGDHSTGPRFSAQQHDRAIEVLEDLLKPHTLEEGFHCTRLTGTEVDAIQSSGMQLPNKAMLEARIEARRQESALTASDAKALLQTHQANDSNRAAKIWFYFYPPHRAGEHASGDFFRYWGGEALYNSHDSHSRLGPLLRQIGTPCIVVADVPIAALSERSRLCAMLIRRFFNNRGETIREKIDFHGHTKTAVPAEAIRKIVRFPSVEFTTLTDCDAWHEQLTP